MPKLQENCDSTKRKIKLAPGRTILRRGFHNQAAQSDQVAISLTSAGQTEAPQMIKWQIHMRIDP